MNRLPYDTFIRVTDGQRQNILHTNLQVYSTQLFDEQSADLSNLKTHITHNTCVYNWDNLVHLWIGLPIHNDYT